MKITTTRSRILLLLCCMLFVPFLNRTALAQTINTWTQKANFGGTARLGVCGFSIGSKGYIGCGYDGAYKDDFWEYDPATNAWTQKANYAGGTRSYPSGFSIGTKGYMGCGTNGSTQSNFYEFDPATNVWTVKASLPVARYGAVGLSIGNKGYIATGSSGGSSYLQDFYEYDPTLNTWTAKATFGGSARVQAAGFTLGGKAYVGTGYGGSAQLDFWEYDPATNTWTAKANFPGAARNGAIAFAIGSKGYMGCGGNSSSSNFQDFYEYDATLNTWTIKANGGGGARGNGPAGFSIGTKGYIGAGSTGAPSGYKNDFWEYTAATGEALNFDGVNDYVQTTIDADSDVMPNTTWEAWVYPTATDAVYRQIISIDDGGWDRFIGTISGSVVIGVGTQWIPTTFDINQWQHIAVVYSGSTVKFYKNGIEYSTTCTQGSGMSTSNLMLGCKSSPISAFWSGNVDEVRIWNVARTQCEINTYKNCEIMTTATGLIANYHFNHSESLATNTTQTTLTDVSGNLKDGSLINFALTGSTSNWIAPGAVISNSTTPASINFTVGASVSSSVICLGNLTTLNGTGANTYTWTSGVTNAVAFTPTTTTSYTVIGTSTTGCTSSNSVAVQSITVNPLPVVTASTTNSVICNGATTALNGGGASTYVWTGGVTNGTAFSPSSTQSYTVTGTNATTGCTNTAVKSVTVNSLPVVTASATNSVICNGATTILNGGGANTYTWTGGITNAVAFFPATTTTYTVTGTNTLTSCTSTNIAAQTITVNSLPVVTASATNSVICNGATTILNGSGADTYTWSAGVTNGSVITPSSTQSYSVSGTNTLTGCTSTNSAVQAITVNPLPVITVNSGSVCEGQPFTMIPSGASTYTYSGGSAVVTPTINSSYSVTGTDANGCISSSAAIAMVTVNTLPVIIVNSGVICNGQSFTITPSGAFTYTISGGTALVTPTITSSYSVTGTDTAGCVSAFAAVSDVTVNALPIITTIISNAIICEGGSTTLNGGGADTYTWSGGVSDGVAFSPLVSGSFTVTGTNTLTGCTNTGVESVTVNPSPVITAVSSNSLICAGQTVSLTASGAITYTWSTSASGASIVDSPTLTTTYIVTGEDGNGCMNSDTLIQSVSSCTGIESLNASVVIKLYPNPGSGLATLELPSEAQVVLTNALGEIISNQKLAVGDHQIDITLFANGIYFVKVIQHNKQQTIKLVKE
jgi:N-acetylneuraminic acid mutarotase